jgi:hypothetical protein
MADLALYPDATIKFLNESFEMTRIVFFDGTSDMEVTQLLHRQRVALIICIR